MSGKYLLDTNVVIALFAGDEQVVGRLRQAEAVLIPAVVLGELYFGACKSSHSAENQAKIDQFAAQNSIINCDSETARRYGQIKGSLKQMGRPIPENDIWIAATAIQHSITLVTRDAHFDDLADLGHERW